MPLLPFGVGTLPSKEQLDAERELQDLEREWEKDRDRAKEEGKPIPPHPREYTKAWPLAITILAAGCLYGSLTQGNVTHIKESVIFLKNVGIRFGNIKAVRFSLLFNLLNR